MIPDRANLGLRGLNRVLRLDRADLGPLRMIRDDFRPERPDAGPEAREADRGPQRFLKFLET